MKSLAIIILCALAASGCNRTSPAELFKKAQEAQKLQDFPGALEQYGRLIEEHPGSPEAEAAQFLLATILHNDTHDYQKAVEAYKTYADRYPDGKQAPNALFLAGYLYNNELHNLDSAASAYRRFLERFPQNEMATSAKFELDNLGKSPEELLPKPPVAEEPAAQHTPKKRSK